MSHQNRKVTKAEREHLRKVINQAYPDLVPVFGSHSSYGGHRAPRDHTFSFRLRDAKGKYHSNVIWLMPEGINNLTPGNIVFLVDESNGK